MDNDLQYNKNYQYDFSGLYPSFMTNPDGIYYANAFEAYDDDLIAAVGTYFDGVGVEYTVDIYVNDGLVYTQSGISPFTGYHTIKLDKYVSIKKGDNFTASIRSNALPYCNDMRMFYENDVSLASYNGEQWADLVSQGVVACLKVYTLPSLIMTENIMVSYSSSKQFAVNVSQGNVNVTVSINDINITNTTDENGIALFSLPLLDPGVYLITTSYNNISVINTVTVFDSIDVPREITVGYNANVNVTVRYYDAEGNLASVATFPVINKIGTYSATFTNYLTNQTVSSKINVVSRFSGNKDINM